MQSASTFLLQNHFTTCPHFNLTPNNFFLPPPHHHHSFCYPFLLHSIDHHHHHHSHGSKVENSPHTCRYLLLLPPPPAIFRRRRRTGGRRRVCSREQSSHDRDGQEFVFHPYKILRHSHLLAQAQITRPMWLRLFYHSQHRVCIGLARSFPFSNFFEFWNSINLWCCMQLQEGRWNQRRRRRWREGGC